MPSASTLLFFYSDGETCHLGDKLSTVKGWSSDFGGNVLSSQRVNNTVVSTLSAVTQNIEFGEKGRGLFLG